MANLILTVRKKTFSGSKFLNLRICCFSHSFWVTEYWNKMLKIFKTSLWDVENCNIKTNSCLQFCFLFDIWDYLALQSVGQKKQSSIKAPCGAKHVIMLKEESRAQATRLHWWLVVHMVLIENPLRAGYDAKKVCSQLNGSTTCSWRSTCRNLGKLQDVNVLKILHQFLIITNQTWSPLRAP